MRINMIFLSKKMIGTFCCILFLAIANAEVLNEYSFDNSLGKTIIDSGSTKSHLSMKGFNDGEGITETPLGLGVSFRGKQLLEGVLRLTPGDYENIAVECWVRCKDKNPQKQIFLQVGTAERISLYFKDNSVWCSVLYSDSKVHVTIFSPLENQDDWHHITALRDAKSKELKLYVDGKFKSKKSCPAPVSLTKYWRRNPAWNKALSSIYIGDGDIYHKAPFQGQVDEVRVIAGDFSEKEIAERANIKGTPTDMSKFNATLISCASDLLETLMIGMYVLEKNELPCSGGQMGDYLKKRLYLLGKELKRLQKEKNAKTSEIRALYIDLEKLEKEMILESINVIHPIFLSTRRMYPWCSNFSEPVRTEHLKKRKNYFLKEINEIFRDWQRNDRALKRFGINSTPCIEEERINCHLPQNNDLVTDRFFDQEVAFYKAIAQERYRLGAAILSSKRELAALAGTVKIRSEMGAKIKTIAQLKKQAESLIALWWNNYNIRNFPNAYHYEKKTNEIIEKIKDKVCSIQNGIPVVRPGVSFKSTGRYAFGGNWQSLPNCEGRGSSFFRGAQYAGLAKPFSPYNDGNAEWNVSCGIPDSLLESFEIIDASWTYSHRRYTYRNIDNGKAVTQDCWWSMLAPGTLFDTFGPEIVFSDNTLGNPLPPDKVLGVFGSPKIFKRGEKLNPSEMTESWLLLLWENSAPQVPILISFEKRPQKFEWRKDGLTAVNSKGIGKSALTLAYGAAPKAPDWSKSWSAPPVEVIKHCRKLTEHIVFYPLSIDEFYCIDGHKIKIWDELSKYIEIKDDWNTPVKPYMPIPFMYALGIESGVPIEFEEKLSESLLDTKYGFFRTVEGKRLSYKIPRFRMWQREVLKPSGEDKLVSQYNQVLPKDRPSEAARFYETLGFSSGWCLMDKATMEWLEYYKNPKELEGAIAGKLPLKTHFSMPFPVDIDFTIEPTMGKSYWFCGWRGFRHGIRLRGDLSCFNMYTLSGAYAYAKLFGKWNMVEKHWDVMRNAFDGIAARQDWAVPGHDCLSSGWVFSGDMLGDGWRVNSLMASMAGILGDKEYEDQAVYQGARTMVTVGCAMNPNTVIYNAHVKNSVRAQSPKATVSIGSVDSGLYTGPYEIGKGWAAPLYNAGCVIYDYPFYDCLLDFYPETSRMMMDEFIKQVPGWYLRDGAYRNPKHMNKLVRTQHSWQTLKFLAWTTKNKEKIRELYNSNFAPDKESRMSTFYDWTMFGNVLPHIIAQNDPIWLAEWDQAVIKSGEYDRKARCADIKLESFLPGKLSMVSLLAPTKVTLNGIELGKSQYSYDSERNELFILFNPGKNKVQIFLPDYSPEKLDYPDFVKQNLGHKLNLAKAPKPVELKIKTLEGDLKTDLCETVDISKFCNMGFADETPGDKRGGTHDDGETWLFPKGKTRIRGVPFEIIDPDANNGKSCIVLKGGVKDFFPLEVKNIPVNKIFRRLFFLHGTAYTGKPDGQTVMTYVLHFDGGKKRVLNIRRGINIGEWKSSKSDTLPDLPEARAGNLFPPAKKGQYGKGVSGYVYEWKNDVKAPGVTNLEANQRGLARLESMDIISYNKAVPMIFAISGESVK